MNTELPPDIELERLYRDMGVALYDLETLNLTSETAIAIRDDYRVSYGTITDLKNSGDRKWKRLIHEVAFKVSSGEYPLPLLSGIDQERIDMEMFDLLLQAKTNDNRV